VIKPVQLQGSAKFSFSNIAGTAFALLEDQTDMNSFSRNVSPTSSVHSLATRPLMTGDFPQPALVRPFSLNIGSSREKSLIENLLVRTSVACRIAGRLHSAVLSRRIPGKFQADVAGMPDNRRHAI
jgi:hypothetical protein